MQEEKCEDLVAQEIIEYETCISIAMALFRLAAQDLKYGSSELKMEVRDFLDSTWFESICEGINLNPNEVKFSIINNDRIASRVSYE